MAARAGVSTLALGTPRRAGGSPVGANRSGRAFPGCPQPAPRIPARARCSRCHMLRASRSLSVFGEAKASPASIDSGVRGAGGKQSGEPGALPGQNGVGTGTGMGPGARTPEGLSPSWAAACPRWAARAHPSPAWPWRVGANKFYRLTCLAVDSCLSAHNQVG